MLNCLSFFPPYKNGMLVNGIKLMIFSSLIVYTFLIDFRKENQYV